MSCHPSSMFYLTGGFTGEGVVCIMQARRLLAVDFRFVEQAAQQAPGFEIVPIAQGAFGQLRFIAETCRKADVEALFYEDAYLTVRQHSLLRDLADDAVTLLPLGGAIERLRRVKVEREIDCIRRACEITAAAFEASLRSIREGMTERELCAELDGLLKRHGAESYAFDTLVAFGERSSLCHGAPSDRRLCPGDLIAIDLGARVGGYCADMTRTLAFGQPKPELIRMYETVLRAQTFCEEAAAPNVSCSELDRMAREIIDGAGYAGCFGHGLGHGVGVDVHEDPRLNPSCRDLLASGNVITVEPGVYIPGLGGVRIENTLLITDHGHETLTKAPRDLIIL